MGRGKHLIVDFSEVDNRLLLDDKRITEAIVEAVKRAGANVLSFSRYHLGHNSPPGFAAVVMLDESHCSFHAYSELGIAAADFFTCGDTNPMSVFDYFVELIPELNKQNCKVVISLIDRFNND